MKNKIFVAGNILLDFLYPITGYPAPGHLTTIEDNISKAVGGLVCNVGIDLKRLMPDAEVYAIGLVGNDDSGDYALNVMQAEGLDTSMVGITGSTSFTAVMSDTITRERTFFQYRGANALFSEEHMDFEHMDGLLHIGYILLLDALDAEDEEYGTKMARLLSHAKEHGLETSIDVVSESGNRFARLVKPALRYTDYCIINEIETESTVGIPLRDDSGSLIYGNIIPALRALFDCGVGKWAVIHTPEGGFAMDRDGSTVSCGSVNLPDGWIKGTVGAGDAFCAGILSAVAMGMSLADAVRLGNCSAAASLAAPGAAEAMSTVADALTIGETHGFRDIPAIM